MQVFLFSIALSDPKVMRHQLDGLAKSIPQRFARDWVELGASDDAVLLSKVPDYAALLLRAERLKRKGIVPDASIMEPLEGGSFVERVNAIAVPDVRARIDAQLTALEADAPALWKLQDAEAAKTRRAAEQEAYIAQLTWQADQRVFRAREALETTRTEYDRSLMRARLNPNGNGFETRDLAETMKRQEELLQSAIAEREKLLTHLAKVANEGAAGTPQTQQSQVPHAEAQASAPPACHDGGRCRIIEKTIFCETLGQMQAVLAKPAGPQRRKVLHDLIARRDCLMLEADAPIYPRLPLLSLTPTGEAPVMAVAARLEAGWEGFVLQSAIGGDPQTGR